MVEGNSSERDEDDGDKSSETPEPNAANPSTYPLGDDDDTSRGVRPPMPQHSDGGTSRLLAWLLGLSPFIDLHHKALAKTGGKHPWREGICVTLDCAFRVMVLALLLAIIGAVAWKTLAPLPSFWEWHAS